MPLPLLLAAGAGILGGGRYLLNQADQRSAEETAGGLADFLQGSQLAQERPDIAQSYLDRAQQQTSGGSLLGNFGAGDQVEGLLNAARNDEINLQSGKIQQQQAAAAQQAAMQDPYDTINRGIADGLSMRYNQDLKVFSGVQQQFQAAQEALANPNNLNSITTIYNLFNILEPGGRVTANEDGVFQGVGTAGNQAANWLNKWKGEGLTDATRKEIENAIWAQYQPKFEAAKRSKDFYSGELSALEKQGRNVRSPVGRLGIDWQDPQRAQVGTQQQGLGPVPEGYSLSPNQDR